MLRAMGGCWEEGLFAFRLRHSATPFRLLNFCCLFVFRLLAHAQVQDEGKRGELGGLFGISESDQAEAIASVGKQPDAVRDVVQDEEDLFF
jgi:hypothetical protein